jgi:hypothetical protein
MEDAQPSVDQLHRVLASVMKSGVSSFIGGR